MTVNEPLRIGLREAVEDLGRVIDDLEDVAQDEIIQPLYDIMEVLEDMCEYHIYTFGCMDHLLNELYVARRADSPDYEEWCRKLELFLKKNTIYIGGGHHEIDG